MTSSSTTTLTTVLTSGSWAMTPVENSCTPLTSTARISSIASCSPVVIAHHSTSGISSTRSRNDAHAWGSTVTNTSAPIESPALA
ncbi:hypothetical protein SRABI76_02389 [Microbacterium oxydans]|nr:hypothetical protein SRABI76_02389 [Microbacterium oxydans]